MNRINIGLSDFHEALSLLNDKLRENGTNIEIRAIGGYAMLYHKLREGGYTMDVDTATESYSNDVNRLIKEVAQEKELDEDWINNDPYHLAEVADVLHEIEWVEDNTFSNIRLYIASIQSLLLLKARAVHFGGLVPRITDKTDLLDILRALGIHNIKELQENINTREFESQYPRCFSFLAAQEQW